MAINIRFAAFLTIMFLLAPTLGIADFYARDDITGRDLRSVHSMVYINGTYIYQNGSVVLDASSSINATSMNWNGLDNYPSACSSGRAVTTLSDSVICSVFVNAVSGDYIVLSGSTISLNETKLNETAEALDTNCSGNGSCALIVYDDDTIGWDKDSSDDFDGAWSSLTSVPAGFADNVDNNTQLSESKVEDYVFDNDNTGSLTTTGDIRAANFIASGDVTTGDDLIANSSIFFGGASGPSISDGGNLRVIINSLRDVGVTTGAAFEISTYNGTFSSPRIYLTGDSINLLPQDEDTHTDLRIGEVTRPPIVRYYTGATGSDRFEMDFETDGQVIFKETGAGPQNILFQNLNVNVTGELNLDGSTVCTPANGLCNVTDTVGGNVTAIGGVDNRIAVFTNSTNVEGDSSFTWNNGLEITRTNHGRGLGILGSDGSTDVSFHIGFDGADFGYYWNYIGSQSGNDNELELWTQGGTGTDKQVYEIEQDGEIAFNQRVSVNDADPDAYLEIAMNGVTSVPGFMVSSSAASDGDYFLINGSGAATYSGSELCTAENGLCNQSTVSSFSGSINSSQIINTPVACSTLGDLYFMDRFNGSTSDCVELNQSLLNITQMLGYQEFTDTNDTAAVAVLDSRVDTLNATKLENDTSATFQNLTVETLAELNNVTVAQRLNFTGGGYVEGFSGGDLLLCSGSNSTGGRNCLNVTQPTG